MFVDDRLDSVDYSKIINLRHFDRLVGYLDNGRIAAGGRHDSQTLRIEPTVLVDVPQDAAVMREEIFGSVLPVISVESLDAAIEYIGLGAKPLSASLFTRSRESGRNSTYAVSARNIRINDTPMFITVPC